VRCSLVLVIACARPTPAPPPLARPYDGVTRCGSYAPIEQPRPPRPLMPEREPMSRPNGDASFVMPRIETTGDLSSDFVERPIEAKAGELRACYIAHGRGAYQRVKLAFQIGADGAVSHVAVYGDDPQLDECLCAHVATLRYPAFEGTASVTYPVIFD
jgi:hypothetical protein